MNKLKLRLDALEVESFSTHAPQPRGGTVLAHSGYSCNTLNEMTCAQYQTCGGNGTCDRVATCNPMCWPQAPDPDRDPADPDESLCCSWRCS